MASRVISSAAQATRRRGDVKLAEKFNLATLNGGKSPFVVSSNKLLKATKDAKPSPQQRVKDLYSIEYLLGGAPQKTKKPAKKGAKKGPFDVASAKLM